MYSKEEQMSIRADIDDSLNSSDFAIQTMMIDEGQTKLEFFIVKKDEKDRPLSVNFDDVDFLKRRFAPLEFAEDIEFQEFMLFPGFTSNSVPAVNVLKYKMYM